MRQSGNILCIEKDSIHDIGGRSFAHYFKCLRRPGKSHVTILAGCRASTLEAKDGGRIQFGFWMEKPHVRTGRAAKKRVARYLS
jgi:hypothetical protein